MATQAYTSTGTVALATTEHAHTTLREQSNTEIREQEQKLEVAEQHSLPRTIVLHLLPGLILTIAYLITAPLVMRVGLPPSVALLLCVLVLLIPFVLRHLFAEGKRKNGSLSLKNVVLYQERTALGKSVAIVLGVTVWSFLVYILTTPLQVFLLKNLFSWLPDIFSLSDLSHYSRGAFIITLALNFVVNGVLAPIVEELYFRGYLLPRISRFGRWSPFINLALFSLYHFWQPWQNPTNLIALWPHVYMVWKRRDVRLSIAIHCTLNIVGALLLLAQYSR